MIIQNSLHSLGVALWRKSWSEDRETPLALSLSSNNLIHCKKPQLYCVTYIRQIETSCLREIFLFCPPPFSSMRSLLDNVLSLQTIERYLKRGVEYFLFWIISKQSNKVSWETEKYKIQLCKNGRHKLSFRIDKVWKRVTWTLSKASQRVFRENKTLT